MRGPLLAGLLLLCLPALAAAGEGDYVRLRLDGPATPYGQVEMEVKPRGQTVVVRLTQSFGAPYGSRDAVGLATEPELASLLTELAAGGAFELKTTRAAAGLTAPARYTVELSSGGRQHAFSVERPEQLPDRRYVTVVRRIRSWVVGFTGEPRFFDGRVSAEDSGFLHLEAAPAGRVFLNEVLLADTTPIDAVRLPLGSHSVRVVAADGRSRTVEITIEKGKTTALRLRLE